MNRRLLVGIAGLGLLVTAVALVVFLTTSSGSQDPTTVAELIQHQRDRTAATRAALDSLNVFRAAGVGLGAAGGLVVGAVVAYTRREDI